nr:hypothetical protein [Tanacetum cinerariifolium]
MGINYGVIGMIEGLEDEETESEITEDEIRNHLEHDYMEEVLLEEEQKREAYQTEHNEFDQEALRHTLEEEARLKNQLSKHECMGEIGFRLGDFKAEDNHKSHAELEIPSAELIAVVTLSVDKWKQHAEPREQPDLKPQAKKRGLKKHQHPRARSSGVVRKKWCQGIATGLIVEETEGVGFVTKGYRRNDGKKKWATRDDKSNLNVKNVACRGTQKNNAFVLSVTRIGGPMATKRVPKVPKPRKKRFLPPILAPSTKKTQVIAGD